MRPIRNPEEPAPRGLEGHELAALQGGDTRQRWGRDGEVLKPVLDRLDQTGRSLAADLNRVQNFRLRLGSVKPKLGGSRLRSTER